MRQRWRFINDDNDSREENDDDEEIDSVKRARIKVRADITSEQATSDQTQRVVWRRRRDRALFL